LPDLDRGAAVSPGTQDNELEAVAALSASDAWAVGTSVPGLAGQGPALHCSRSA